MARRRSPLAVICLTVFIDLVGFGIVIPILPLYAERFGASPLVIGLLLGVYSLMQCICAPMLGKLSDRIGRRPVLLVSIAGTAVGFLLMGLANSLRLLFVARIIDGMTGGNISTAQAYIADVTPPHERSKGMGLIGAAFGIGLICGPAIGGTLSRISIAAPFFCAAALALCNVVAIYVWLPESLPVERRRQAHEHPPIAEVFREARGRSAAISSDRGTSSPPRSAGSPARSLPLVLGTYFCMTAAFSLLTATYPLFTKHRFGYDAAHNGYIFAAQGILGAIIQGLLLGRLLKLTGDRRLAVAGAAVLTLSMFLLPLSASVPMLFAATAGVAIGHGLIAAPLNGLASKSVSEASQGRVLGLMQSTASFARIVGPVMGGLLLNYDAVHGVAQYGRTPYWAGGGVMLVACALAAAL